MTDNNSNIFLDTLKKVGTFFARTFYSFIGYYKEKPFDASYFTSLILFIFVFPVILPSIMFVYQILVALGTIGYVIYKALKYLEKNKGVALSENKKLISASGSIVSIIIGLVFGFILMMAVNFGQSFQGIFIIIQGGFRDVSSIGTMIYFAVPYILTGLSVAFAFRTGLFNIGATGQFTMGAVVATYIGYKYVGLGEFSPFLHWFLAIAAATIVGGLWGSVGGFLKAYRNVNEVVTSIMMNYIAMWLAKLIVQNYMFNANTGAAHYVLETSFTPKLGLDRFFDGSTLDGSIIIAILVVLILHIVLNKTTFGFELKAVGYNRDAAKYSGMNAKRNIVISMIIAGAVAGLAGGLKYLAPGIRFPSAATLMGEGFTGIAISLLGLSSPIGVLFAGLFYGSLQSGGFYLQLLDFTPEIIDIIIAVIIYASALSLFLRSIVSRRLKAREMALEMEGVVIPDKPETVDAERSDE